MKQLTLEEVVFYCNLHGISQSIEDLDHEALVLTNGELIVSESCDALTAPIFFLYKHWNQVPWVSRQYAP